MLKCSVCLYKNNCSLREIAKDITGCEGHSKDRICYDCKNHICKELGKGNIVKNFKCIRGNKRFSKNFETLDQFHNWHTVHWNEVVLNG